MKPEETVDYFLKIVWQTVANKYNQIASEYGITQALGYMLINIHEEGTAVSQIASLSGVKSTSLSRMLNNMQELGLIYRETDPADKRSVKIFLTPFGVEKRQIAKDVVKKFNEYLNAHISDKERLQLIKSLNKINQLTFDYKPQ
ncbi:MarR family winged helix-turn-helix transcriptional regulator [Daejeonella lutea]|uniref:DNA-binding transcriptional regulator, MarR family n=1 Tax=Daejeonella lutea TaxID=572036 RepID=A0A1T5EFB3_9SPHI|nr:MarR family transcriptional regulator [Daejeonella lutea]SKB82777.1 DNA-binding transcriptional regulator, MarR family [Daejeonella lutea]